MPKYLVTLKIRLDDASLKYEQALAYKQRISDLAMDLAPGGEGSVGGSIEDEYQLMVQDTRLRVLLKIKLATLVHSHSANTLPDDIIQLLQEAGYVPKA